MSRSVKVDIPIVYPLSFLPLRGTKEKTVVVADRVQVEIPSVGLDEAPLRLDATSGFERYIGREFDGELYMPNGFNGLRIDEDHPRKFEGFYRAGDVLHHLFPGKARADLHDLAKRNSTERPTGLTRVIHDGHDEVRASTIGAAGNFLLIDGGLFRRRPAPMYAFSPTAESKWSVGLDHGSSWYPRHYGFALNRREDAEAFRERVLERGGVSVESFAEIRIRHLDWETHHVPEVARNASSGVVHVLSSLGNELHRYPPEMIRIAMELSRARGVSGEPAQDPVAINLLLRELEEAIPPKDGLWLRRHIPNALDAIVSSQDFVAERLAEDDMEALTGMKF